MKHRITSFYINYFSLKLFTCCFFILITGEAFCSLKHITVLYDTTDGEILFNAVIQENLKLLHSDKLSEKKAAIARLGGIKARQASGELITLAETETQDDVIRLSVGALGNIGNPDALPVIRKHLNHKNQEVKKEAVNAYMSFNESAEKSVVMDFLTGDDILCRQYSILCAGKSVYWSQTIQKDTSLLHQVINFSEEDDILLKCAVIFFLGSLKTKESKEQLVFFLKNEDDMIRIEAASALGKNHTGKAVPILRKMTRERDENIVCSAAGTLASMEKKSGFRRLAELLQSEKTEIRWRTVKQLGQIDDERSISILEDYKKKENDPGLLRMAKRAVDSKNKPNSKF